MERHLCIHAIRVVGSKTPGSSSLFEAQKPRRLLSSCQIRCFEFPPKLTHGTCHGFVNIVSARLAVFKHAALRGDEVLVAESLPGKIIEESAGNVFESGAFLGAEQVDGYGVNYGLGAEVFCH